MKRAIKSDDFVASYEAKQRQGTQKLSSAEKTSRLQSVWNADTTPNQKVAFQKIGLGMVGPIQIRLKYEGVLRNILVEDPLEKGYPMPYEVLDDLGQAYVLNQTDAEVFSTPFEGKWVTPNLFRLASFPFIRKEDTFFLRANIVEHAQEETRIAILKQEDGRLFTLLSDAVDAYATNADHTITPDHIVEIGAGQPLDFVDFYDAVSRIEPHELEARRVVLNPVDARDFYTWDTNTTGWAFKDRVVDGATINEFGEFTLQRSIMVPQGTIWLLPEPNFLGVMPVMYSLDVEENNQIEQFHRGWVMDELIGMLVLNPRGLAVIKKV